ncbi:MAG: hypothetical protein QOG25_3557 [Acetobacteraceae bacterium]|nr:hypothetical protein [Acetobacteraceae bacterium]
MSDRLTLANAIEDAGIERGKAERMASVIFDVIQDSIATKADIASARGEMKGGIAGVKMEIAGLRTEIVDVRTEIAGVSAKADLIEHRLLTRLGGLMIVVGGVLFAALHYWPPIAHG